MSVRLLLLCVAAAAVLWGEGAQGLVVTVRVADAAHPVFVSAFGMRAGGTVESRVLGAARANVTLCTDREFRDLFFARTYRESAVADRVTRALLLAGCAETVRAGTRVQVRARGLYHVFVTSANTTTEAAEEGPTVTVTLRDVDGAHLGVGEAALPRVHVGLTVLWAATLAAYGASVVVARCVSRGSRALSLQAPLLFVAAMAVRVAAAGFDGCYWTALADTGAAAGAWHAGAAVLAATGDVAVLAAAALLARGVFVDSARYTGGRAGTGDAALALCTLALLALAALDDYTGLFYYAAVALLFVLLPRLCVAAAGPVRFYAAVRLVYRRARLAPQPPRRKHRIARAVQATCAVYAAAAPAALLAAAWLPWDRRALVPLVRDAAAWAVLVPLAALAHPALYRPLCVLQDVLAARRSALVAVAAPHDADPAAAAPPVAVVMPGHRVAVAWEKPPKVPH